MSRKLDENGYKLITQFEGFSSKPYLCSARIPTIGYGNTYYLDGKKVTLLDKEITKAEAYELFKSVADKFAKRVDKLVTSEITQNQFNALVSFNFNTGALKGSTLLKKVNANPKDKSIGIEFMKWVNAGGKRVEGLINRRKKEVEIYFK